MDFSKLLSAQTSTFASPALRQITLDVLRVHGINLGQGVCNLPVPEYVIERATAAEKDGINRYTNPRGLQSLREAIAKKLAHYNGIETDPDVNVLITCGATGAFEGVCGILLDPGDEVVVFEPSYPYHLTALRRYGANVKTIKLRSPNWEIDFDELRALISDRTKFLLLNTPNNPTGKVFTKDELEQISNLLIDTGCLLVTDEIYEYMTFDGMRHCSPASIPSLSNRTVTIGGYSKTFSITGWRIGFVVAPASIAGPLTSFLDAVYVCAPAPLQQAVADGIDHFEDSFYHQLNAKYESKRNFFAEGLRQIGLMPLVPQGAYYMICLFDQAFPEMSSNDFVQLMIRESGVGAVPSSDFVRDSNEAKWVRFCLANEDEVLEEALQRLQSLRAQTR